MPPRSDRLVGYQVQKSNRYVIRIVIATILMTLAILAILPFTQALSGDPRDKTLRSVDVANLPPPEPPPPEPPPPEEEEEQEEEPELEQPPELLDLSQLESALNPGLGGAGTAAFDLDAFSSAINTGDELQIFDVIELDRTPRMVKRVMPQYPTELLARGVTGSVTLIIIIDQKGEVTIESVSDWQGSRTFIQPTRLAITRCRFEIPTKDGKPVRARYKITIPFQL
ncbi:TonB family protein [Puniceicoccales bacterium CK1056]|uniref:TonB family protein n=1 Tax=Oceanipulchritudo coccoides TaxID=2706888 RepID=A0A6B2M227_9BACT|nr:energy transducer TonB [Oceanipulchritudo coccoides]NDV62137.1 TonB family protein [Oceanipulchritudo coccoides]